MMKLALVFLAISTATVLAGEYVWRLTQQQAVDIATHALGPASYDAHKFHVRDAKRSPKHHEWLVGFDPPRPGPIHGDLLVIGDHQTRGGKGSDPRKVPQT